MESIERIPGSAAPACPFAEGIALASDVPTMSILGALFAENCLLRDIGARTGLDDGLVTSRLRELASQGMVRVLAHASDPGNTLYGLTRKGVEFHPILGAIQAWEDKWTHSP